MQKYKLPSQIYIELIETKENLYNALDKNTYNEKNDYLDCLISIIEALDGTKEVIDTDWNYINYKLSNYFDNIGLTLLEDEKIYSIDDTVTIFRNINKVNEYIKDKYL